MKISKSSFRQIVNEEVQKLTEQRKTSHDRDGALRTAWHEISNILDSLSIEHAVEHDDDLLMATITEIQLSTDKLLEV